MTIVIHQSTSQFTRAALFSLLLAAALASFTFAQTQAPAPQFYSVRVTQVKPEMAQEYRAFMQNETIPAYKKGGVKLRNTAVTATFGPSMEYISVEPVASLKQFDEPAPLLKALGEEGNRTWNAKWLRLIASSRAYLAQFRPDLSIIPTPGAPPAKLGLSITVTVAPGRTAEYESYVKDDLLPIIKKAWAKGVVISKVVLGGDGSEYHAVIPLDSFDELEKGSQVAALAGFGKLAAKVAGVVLHSETAVYRYVPELSIRPEAQK